MSANNQQQENHLKDQKDNKPNQGSRKEEVAKSLLILNFGGCRVRKEARRIRFPGFYSFICKLNDFLFTLSNAITHFYSAQVLSVAHQAYLLCH